MAASTWSVLILTAPMLIGLAAAYPHRAYHDEADVQTPEKNVRHIDGLGGGHLLRDTWALEQLQHLAQQQQQQQQLQQLQQPCRQRRGLDSLSGVTFGGAKKRFNSLNGGTFGTNKRNFDEIDRTSFNSFTKKNFDEIDRAGFDSFVKRAPVAAPELDDLERPLYGLSAGLQARLHRLQEQEQQQQP